MTVIERDFDPQELLNRPLLAHLATFGDPGPCETPVWFLWEDEAVWIVASSKSSFAKRLRKDRRASVGIVDFDVKGGLLRHLGMRGVATVLPMDADRRTRLITRYLGGEDSWDSRFKENVVERQDVLVKFVPTTVVARDQSYFRSAGPSVTALDHVQLAMPAGEEDRARDFYVGLLGLQEVAKPAELADRGGCWFRSEEVDVHLGVDTDFKPAKKAHPAFRCTDYDGFIKRLSDLGVRVAPGEVPFGGKAHCYVADPFGNRIELIAR